MTLKYIWRSFSLGCHLHVHFSYPWHAFASHGLPAIAELLVSNCFCILCCYVFSWQGVCTHPTHLACLCHCIWQYTVHIWTKILPEYYTPMPAVSEIFEYDTTVQKYTSVCLCSTDPCIFHRTLYWSRTHLAGREPNQAASHESQYRMNALWILFCWKRFHTQLHKQDICYCYYESTIY